MKEYDRLNDRRSELLRAGMRHGLTAEETEELKQVHEGCLELMREFEREMEEERALNG